MRRLRLAVLILALAATAGFAQQWEIGGGGGGGFLPGVPVSSSLGSATTGFQSGAAFGGFLGQNLYPRLSGEIRYGYLQSNLKLTSGGTTATFSGVAHVVHYDLLLHATPRGSRAEVFVAVGGGMKIFRGTGKEQAYQPLSQFGYFTKAQTIKPMASVGAGVRFRLAPQVFLRTEFRDYITAFPTDVITPAPGAKFGSLLHDFVPMVEISYVF